MPKRILAYTLFGLGFLSITFFRNYSGVIIPYPLVFWILGLTLFWGGWALLKWAPKVKDEKKFDSVQTIIDNLKTNGEKIKVEFSKCDIKENNYLEEKEIDSFGHYLTPEERDNDYDIVRALTPHYGTTRTENVQTNQSVLIFKLERNNKTETYISNILPFERVTLLFKLDSKMVTTLYVDKNDRSKYYFDLEFLFI
jgi:hypothetical protein